jgi:hypothetical protein
MLHERIYPGAPAPSDTAGAAFYAPENFREQAAATSRVGNSMRSDIPDIARTKSCPKVEPRVAGSAEGILGASDSPPMLPSLIECA